MGKLLGDEQKKHRELYFPLFADMIRGMNMSQASKKYKRSPSIIKITIYRMTWTLVMTAENDPDCPDKNLRMNLTPVKQLQQHPEYWVNRLYECQNKIAATSIDLSIVLHGGKIDGVVKRV